MMAHIDWWGGETRAIRSFPKSFFPNKPTNKINFYFRTFFASGDVLNEKRDTGFIYEPSVEASNPLIPPTPFLTLFFLKD